MQLALLARHWKLIAGGIGIAALGLMLFFAKMDAQHWHKKYDAEAAALALTVANVRAATAQARADDEAHARTIQTRDATIAKEANDDLQIKRAAADRAVADYVRLHRAEPAAPCGVGRSSVPAATDATSRIDAPDTATVVPADDLRICAANTLTAEGWSAWWGRVSAHPR